MTAAYLDTHKAIIGTSGAGKTVTAKDEVEALMRDRRHLGIIDPTGAWWGLRSNAAGDGPGFDIPIFGGEHGDVAIEPDQGEAVGNIIAGGVSAIVDVSSMDGRDQRRFVLGLMRALRRKPKGNFHLVVDEADEFAPQTAPDDFGFQLAEQMAWVAKRGRLAGFVLTAITQRPADITKAVLSQVQTIIAHQLIAPQDQKAIDDYLKANGDAATRKTVMSSLAGLARGERWIYSPRLGLLEKGVTPMPSTFDSSRTPEPGEIPIEPKMLAQIDIAAIREALAPRVDETANDLPEAHNSAEILKLCERVARIEADNLALEQDRDFWKERAGVRQAIIERARSALQEQGDEEVVESAYYPPVPTPGVSVKPLPVKAERKPRGSSASGGPSPAALAIADLLDRINPALVTWTQAASMTGRKASGGNFNAARKWLRESGRIVEEGDFIHSAQPAKSGMTRAEAIDLWKSVLSNPAPRMIDAMLAWDEPDTKERLGADLGAAPRGGNFNNGLSQLRRNGLLYEYGSGSMKLADKLPGERG